jgi:TrmH family RNA methyltransferase
VSAIITSPSNPRLKQIRALARRKEREVADLCVVEGIFHVGEAMAAGAVAYLVYAPDTLASAFGCNLVVSAENQGIPVYPVAAAAMAAIASKQNPEGLLAVAHTRRAALRDLGPATHPWLVALVAPQDPGNVGAIMRAIDATGASGLVLLDGGVDPYHPAAIRAAMGETFHRPVATATFAEFAVWARAGGYHVYATSAHGRADYRAAHYQTPLILLMGSERQGLTPEQAALGDELLQLPMHGRVTSLNLAMATGIFLYAIHDALDAQGFFAPPAG